MSLTGKDHALLAMNALTLGAMLIVAWTRPSDRWDVLLYVVIAFLEGFVVRATISK